MNCVNAQEVIEGNTYYCEIRIPDGQGKYSCKNTNCDTYKLMARWQDMEGYKESEQAFKRMKSRKTKGKRRKKNVKKEK